MIVTAGLIFLSIKLIIDRLQVDIVGNPLV
jgi:hypothetical protein